jgi:hypothetical protein
MLIQHDLTMGDLILPLRQYVRIYAKRGKTSYFKLLGEHPTESYFFIPFKAELEYNCNGDVESIKNIQYKPAWDDAWHPYVGKLEAV